MDDQENKLDQSQVSKQPLEMPQVSLPLAPQNQFIFQQIPQAPQTIVSLPQMPQPLVLSPQMPQQVIYFSQMPALIDADFPQMPHTLQLSTCPLANFNITGPGGDCSIQTTHNVTWQNSMKPPCTSNFGSLELIQPPVAPPMAGNEQIEVLPVVSIPVAEDSKEFANRKDTTRQAENQKYLVVVAKEINDYQNEFQEFIKKENNFKSNVGNKKVLSYITAKVSDLERFEKDLSEKTVSQMSKVNLFLSSFIDMYGRVEKIKAQQHILKSQRYLDILEAPPLDPLIIKRLNSIEHSSQFLESELECATHKLEHIWATYQSDHKTMRVPRGQMIYEAIVNESRILNFQKSIVNKLEANFRNYFAMHSNRIPQRKEFPTSSSDSKKNYLSSKSSGAEMVLLGDKVLHMKISSEVSSDSYLDKSLRCIRLANAQNLKPSQENTLTQWHKTHKVIHTKVPKPFAMKDSNSLKSLFSSRSLADNLVFSKNKENEQDAHKKMSVTMFKFPEASSTITMTYTDPKPVSLHFTFGPSRNSFGAKITKVVTTVSGTIVASASTKTTPMFLSLSSYSSVTSSPSVTPPPVATSHSVVIPPSVTLSPLLAKSDRMLETDKSVFCNVSFTETTAASMGKSSSFSFDHSTALSILTTATSTATLFPTLTVTLGTAPVPIETSSEVVESAPTVEMAVSNPAISGLARTKMTSALETQLASSTVLGASTSSICSVSSPQPISTSTSHPQSLIGSSQSITTYISTSVQIWDTASSFFSPKRFEITSTCTAIKTPIISSRVTSVFGATAPTISAPSQVPIEAAKPSPFSSLNSFNIPFFQSQLPQPANIFGGTGLSSTPPAPATGTVFNSKTFGQEGRPFNINSTTLEYFSSNTGSLFGGSSFAPSPPKPSFPKVAFGASGKAVFEGQTTFGSAPNFSGSFDPKNVFGETTTAGQVFESLIQQSSTFGNLTTQNTHSFGNLAQSMPAFNTTPAFGEPSSPAPLQQQQPSFPPTTSLNDSSFGRWK